MHRVWVLLLLFIHSTSSLAYFVPDTYCSMVYWNSGIKDSFSTTTANESPGAVIKSGSSRLFSQIGVGVTFPLIFTRFAIDYLYHSTEQRDVDQVFSTDGTTSVEESLSTNLQGLGISASTTHQQWFFSAGYYPSTSRKQVYKKTGSSETLSYSFQEAGGTAYLIKVGYLFNLEWFQVGPELFYLKRHYKERHYTIENSDGTKSEPKVAGSYSEFEIGPQLGFHFPFLE